MDCGPNYRGERGGGREGMKAEQQGGSHAKLDCSESPPPGCVPWCVL